MKRDQQLVSHFLTAFNQHHGTSFEVIRWPDEENRRTPAIEAVAADASRNTLAFEHTLIEPFEGERTDSDRFIKVFGPLEGCAALMKAGYNVRVGVKVGAIPNGVKWETVADRVRDHLATIVPQVGEIQSIEEIPGPPFPLTVDLGIESHGSEEVDHVWVWRSLPADSLKDVVRRALRRKLPKLVAEHATRHVLLLEQADFAHGHSNIRTAIDELSPEFPELARVHEIWLAITTCWETDEVLFSSELYPNVMDRKLKLDLRTSVTTSLGV
jgi:hypothetical protein